jgi:hypothetical protein
MPPALGVEASPSSNASKPAIRLHWWQPQIGLQRLSLNDLGDLANTRAADIGEFKLSSEIIGGRGDQGSHSKLGLLEWQTGYRGPEPDMQWDFGIGVDGFEEFQ